MKRNIIFILSSLLLLVCQSQLLQAQDNFYKQFKGKIGEREVRVTLIKAPDRYEPRNNLRGEYYYYGIGQIISLTNGNIDELGNLYLEEGIYKSGAGNSSSFIKKGTFMGQYIPSQNRVEGTWFSTDGRQRSSFALQEDYSNGSIPASIIYNDVKYEEAHIRYHYPKFHKHPQAENLNRFVSDSLLGNMGAAMSQFISDYQSAAELGGIVDVFESSNICYIRHNDYGLLGLEYKQESYTGGAHGNYGSRFVNFDLRTSKIIELKDIVSPRQMAGLTKLVEQVLRRHYGIRQDQSLGDFGFSLKNNQFYLTNNFYLNAEGIGFFYNIYEIGPYAIGSQDLFVPYKDAKAFLQKESILAPYLR